MNYYWTLRLFVIVDSTTNSSLRALLDVYILTYLILPHLPFPAPPPPPSSLLQCLLKIGEEQNPRIDLGEAFLKLLQTMKSYVLTHIRTFIFILSIIMQAMVIIHHMIISNHYTLHSGAYISTLPSHPLPSLKLRYTPLLKWTLHWPLYWRLHLPLHWL
jgi:hypothetical protein